jgi:hypothetical protein
MPDKRVLVVSTRPSTEYEYSFTSYVNHSKLIVNMLVNKSNFAFSNINVLFKEQSTSDIFVSTFLGATKPSYTNYHHNKNMDEQDGCRERHDFNLKVLKTNDDR